MTYLAESREGFELPVKFSNYWPVFFLVGKKNHEKYSDSLKVLGLGQRRE